MAKRKSFIHAQAPASLPRDVQFPINYHHKLASPLAPARRTRAIFATHMRGARPCAYMQTRAALIWAHAYFSLRNRRRYLPHISAHFCGWIQSNGVHWMRFVSHRRVRRLPIARRLRRRCGWPCTFRNQYLGTHLELIIIPILRMQRIILTAIQWFRCWDSSGYWNCTFWWE